MKILLIYPYFLEERIHTEDIHAVPIGLFYVAALLQEHRFDVEILNWSDINATPREIERTLREKQPDVIGFSILHANRWGGIEIARTAKRLNPSIKIVFGGIGATFLWKTLLTRYEEIDYIVLGEGEYPFLNLLNHLQNDAGGAMVDIPGIAFWKEGQIIQTEPEGLIRDLDALPNPAKYFSYQHVALTRGCAGACTFCGSPRFWKRRVRFHSTDYFVEQIERLYHRGVRFLHFSDDTFTIDKKRTIAICRKLTEKNLNMSWAAISRVDCVSEEILLWMRKAGCVQISYGVESGSEKLRKFLNKKITTAQIKNAFALTCKFGILPRAYFIYGCPEETWKTIHQTIDMIQDIKPLSAIFYILDIFPGTALYEKYQQDGRISEDLWDRRIEDLLYFEIDPVLTRQDILNFGRKLRESFYEMLPEFVDDITLIDRKDFDPLHADFFSRLGMTFHRGEYARIDEIKGKENIAGKCYERSLKYHPSPRAYLGLGMQRQEHRDFEASITILTEGLRQFPDDLQLNICQAVNYMNLRNYNQALAILLRFEQSRQACHVIAECYNGLGDFKKAAAFRPTPDADDRPA